jgi:hypothetical protein
LFFAHEKLRMNAAMARLSLAKAAQPDAHDEGIQAEKP